MKKSCQLSMLLSFAILVFATTTSAATWTTFSGRVLTLTGTPLCAMVLANGQHMFSCGGVGNYSLTVPLDSQGLITLQVFASGFAPFKQTLTTGQAIGFNVFMDRDVSGRAFSITHNKVPSLRSGWVIVSGNISNSGTPLCAMILINGKNMFSCNQNLGRYSLEVPLDSSGNITLQAFVAGFQPYRSTFSGVTDGSRLNLLLGNWEYSYSIGVLPSTDLYTLSEIQDVNGVNYLVGVDKNGGPVSAVRNEDKVPGSSAELGEFSLLDESYSFDRFFYFDITGPNSVSGFLVWLDPTTGDLKCSSCPWSFVGTRTSFLD